MDYVNLGGAGLQVSRIALGCMSFGTGSPWMLNEDDSRAIIKRALDAGINFFDTANIYSTGESEQIVGRALKDFGPSRDRLVISTKVFGTMGDDPNQHGLTRKHIRHSIDDSLQRLGVDYVDLYQIHRFDPSTPMEETLEALAEVVKAGKALHIGASSMYAWQFAKFQYLADRLRLPRFVTMQNHYNLLYREEEREMNPLCRAERVGLLPWSPLAGGVLAGSRRSGTARANDPRFREGYRRPADEAVVEAVSSLAEARGVGPAEIALAWLLAKPEVTAPIVGATKVTHLEGAFRALSVKLTEDEVAELERPYLTQSIRGHSYV